MNTTVKFLLAAAFLLIGPLIFYVATPAGLEFMERNTWLPYVTAPIFAFVFTAITLGIDFKDDRFWKHFGWSTAIALIEAILIVSQ